MSDNLNDRGPQDRARISMEEPHEVRYWTKKFDVSVETLQRAVDQVGNSAQAVEEHLTRH